MWKKELSNVISCRETLAVIVRGWLQSMLCFVESVTLISFWKSSRCDLHFDHINFMFFRNRLAGKFSVHINCSFPESPRHWRLIPEFPMKYFPRVDGTIINFLFLTDWDLQISSPMTNDHTEQTNGCPAFDLMQTPWFPQKIGEISLLLIQRGGSGQTTIVNSLVYSDPHILVRFKSQNL